MSQINEVAVQKAQEIKIKNPFPGLKPFSKKNSYLFFGREKHVDNVLAKLISNKFIAIIGNSGIGKSSFINCGILPKLYSGALATNSTHWDIISFRPGSDPLMALSDSMNAVYMDNELMKNHVKDKYFVKELVNTNGAQGFIDLVQNITLNLENNLLIYVDQFEEIFRHRKHDQKRTNEINEFINILIQCSQIKNLSVNVVITMRSDFIGECSKYPELTALINDSQFLIPQMTRDEKCLAIVEPVKVMGVQINEDLVNEILNKLGDADDQLPVMQHCLMRTWDYWEKNKIGDEPIGRNHYNAVGGMDSALSVHANEIFNEIDSDLQPVCEKIFKNITERGGEGRTIRRPAKVRELAQICEVPSAKIISIVDRFRMPGRTLLTPFSETSLTEDSIIDVSHESIMRIWGILDKWIDEEQESVKQYLRIAEAAELHQHGKGGLLKSPELQMALRWYETQNPNKVWGIRHHIAYDRTMEYLSFSKTEFEREQRLKEKNQKKRLIFLRAIAGVISFVALIALVLFLYGLEQKDKANIEAENAKEQKIIAERKAKEAKESEKKAIVQEENAKMSAREAQESAEKARISALIAKENERKAKQKEQEAIYQTYIANAAKDTAEIAKKDAFRLRMLSIARTMSVKSLQEPDQVVKALVARQSYNFFDIFEGEGTDPDIYQALYYALKKLKGDDYNSLKGHTDNVRAIVSAPEQPYIYSAGSDGKIIKWIKGEDQYKFESTVYQIPEKQTLKVNKALAISPNGEWLICGGNYEDILMFNLRGPNSPTILQTNTETLFLTFSPDNKNVIYVPSEKQIKIYDVQLRVPKDLGGVSSKINTVAVSPNGSYFLVGTEAGEVIGFDLRKTTSPVLFYKDKDNLPITAINFNTSGVLLAIGNRSGRTVIYDMNTGNLSEPLLGHTAKINYISFNNEGNRLATASWDHTVRIWDLENRDVQPVILKDHNDWVWSIQFSKDGKQLLAGCRDNLIRSWPLDVEKMSSDICQLVSGTGKMTPKTWNSYVGEDINIECTCKNKCK